MSPVGALWPSLLPPHEHGRADLCAVSARGTRVSFADGTTRLCGTSGLWNVNIGYGDETIADAVGEALRRASYLGAFRFENVYARAAAEALVGLCGADRFRRVFFSTSGGAANDLTMKLARLYHRVRPGGTSRQLIVGLRGSYHGLTFGAHALTGEDLGQRIYGVDQRLVRHVDPNDGEQLVSLLRRARERVAAVVVEPVLGSGAVPLTDEYVATLLSLRDRHGFLLVADEVATGFGRTGRWFASERWPAPPDVLVVSKGLTNGTMAAAAVLVADHVAAAFTAVDDFPVHGETQAGTAVSAAAITATIGRMQAIGAVERGARLSSVLDRQITALARRRPEVVAGTTGVGCFRGLRIVGRDDTPVPQHWVPLLVGVIRDEGAIVHPGVNGIQLVPALTYTDDEVTELMHAVERGLDAYLATDPPAAAPARHALAAGDGR